MRELADAAAHHICGTYAGSGTGRPDVNVKAMQSFFYFHPDRASGCILDEGALAIPIVGSVDVDERRLIDQMLDHTEGVSFGVQIGQRRYARRR